MSIIFGVRKAEEDVVEERHLLDLAQATNRWAPDGTFVRAKGRIGMGFQPYHTHQRSNLESQPVVDYLGNMVALDGRIDNAEELCKQLNIEERDSADSLIVLEAFRRWGEVCFSKFIGDWALAIWLHSNRSLYLARDHAGTRSLFFEEKNGCMLFSTYLETFFAREQSRQLDKAYVASYLACQPICDRTPYKGITAIMPAHYLRFDESRVTRHVHWRPAAKGTLRYRADQEYEEHFLSLFRQSVERRTGPGAPILAHLSGGMDSTSIVCMSDSIRNESGTATSGLLNTISYFDDAEPNWNERPYVNCVEKFRGLAGHHVQTSFLDKRFIAAQFRKARHLLPGADSSTPESERKLCVISSAGHFRAIVTGIGGDELLGGVPVSSPELSDYLITLRFKQYFSRGIRWCQVNRYPLIYQIRNDIGFILSLYWKGASKLTKLPPWILQSVKDDMTPSATPQTATKWVLPSVQSNELTWRHIVESRSQQSHASVVRYEYRHPYLDRDLVEFLFAVPREQLVRPGQRRSLMKRALKAYLPKEILERRRKAYISRGPLVLLTSTYKDIAALLEDSLLSRYTLIDLQKLRSALLDVRKGTEIEYLPHLMRAITSELWLQSAPIDQPGPVLRSELEPAIAAPSTST
jgi:asparagine synthase (glutamine-hydrolysing)